MKEDKAEMERVGDGVRKIQEAVATKKFEIEQSAAQLANDPASKKRLDVSFSLVCVCDFLSLEFMC